MLHVAVCLKLRRHDCLQVPTSRWCWRAGGRRRARGLSFVLANMLSCGGAFVRTLTCAETRNALGDLHPHMLNERAHLSAVSGDMMPLRP